MEINPMSGISLAAPVDPMPKSQQDAATQQIVAAVHAINKSELFGQDRELQFTRDNVAHRVVIKIMNRKTGEVIDQIPPETVLSMLDGLSAVQTTGGSTL